MSLPAKREDSVPVSAEDKLRRVQESDADRPSLFPFFLLEFLKIGSFVLVCYIFYTFAEPYLNEAWSFATWLLDDTQ